MMRKIFKNWWLIKLSGSFEWFYHFESDYSESGRIALMEQKKQKNSILTQEKASLN